MMKDTKVAQAIPFHHKLTTEMAPHQVDFFLIEMTTQTPFNQWCDNTLQKMFATRVSFSTLARHVHLAYGGSTDFWIINFTATSICQRRRPRHNTLCLFSKGLSLERKDALLPPAPLSNFFRPYYKKQHDTNNVYTWAWQICGASM